MTENPNIEATIETIADIIAYHLGQESTAYAIAADLVDAGYIEPDKPRRFWTYSKGRWSGPLVSLGGDEFGNRPLAIRLPGGRAFIWNWRIPLRRVLLAGPEDK